MNEITYATGTATLPSSLTSGPLLMFNTADALFEVDNIPTPAKPNVYLKKGAGQHGLFIFDDNGDNAVLKHALNIELYNITDLLGSGTRAGIRVHVDQSNTVPAKLNGVEIMGRPQRASWSLRPKPAAPLLRAWGSNRSPRGLPVSRQLKAMLVIPQYPRIGAQFNHFTTDNILSMHQMNSTMTGGFIFGDAGEGGVGSPTGNFINFQTKLGSHVSRRRKWEHIDTRNLLVVSRIVYGTETEFGGLL